MKFYYNITINKFQDNGNVVEVQSFDYSNPENAELAYRFLCCEISNKKKSRFVFNESSTRVGDFIIKIHRNIPITFYCVDSYDMVIKTSFDLHAIKRTVKELNITDSPFKYKTESYPHTFEDD